MRSTTQATSSLLAGLVLALAEAGHTAGVTVLPFGSLATGAPHPSDADLALVYETGRREAALQLRERLRAAVHRHVGLTRRFTAHWLTWSLLRCLSGSIERDVVAHAFKLVDGPLAGSVWA